MYPPLKEKKNGIKNFDLWAENNPWNKEIKIDYMKKANVNQIKILEIKLVLWLAPFLPPKEIWVQISLWPKWWPLMRGKGSKGKRPNWPNMNMIFLLFSCLLYFQNFSHHMQVWIMKTKQKSNLKKISKVLISWNFILFLHIFGKFKLHFSL
jgi:hypothetical protein